MENEWTVLDKGNLPSDILVGDYEFAHGPNRIKYGQTHSRSHILGQVTGEEYATNKDIYYRKRQPKPPTHQEIMTKWWKGECGVWCKVKSYDPSMFRDCAYLFGDTWHTSNWFIGRESADIPPEA